MHRQRWRCPIYRENLVRKAVVWLSQRIFSSLGPEVVDDNLHEIIAALGGRLTELELLVQKMKMDMDAQCKYS